MRHPAFYLTVLPLLAGSQALAGGNPAIEAATPEAAQATRRSEVVRLDFEAGSFAGWDVRRLVGPHSATVATETVRHGRYAARFELRNGDRVSDGWRAELKDPHNATLGRDVWYGFSTYLPPDYPDHDFSCVLAQWHDQAELGDHSGKPPIAHRIRAGRFYITTAASPVAGDSPQHTDVLFETSQGVKGMWHDFVYRVHWPNGGTGEIDMWMNGERVLEYRGPLGYGNQVRGPYFKLGMYCAEDVPQPHIVYHDSYRRGLSFQDVDPARQDPGLRRGI